MNNEKVTQTVSDEDILRIADERGIFALGILPPKLVLQFAHSLMAEEHAKRSDWLRSTITRPACTRTDCGAGYTKSLDGFFVCDRCDMPNEWRRKHGIKVPEQDV